MKKTAVATPAANDGRISLKKQVTDQGELSIIRPSELAEAGITGVVASGIFEKMEPNKFDTNKKDYFIRDGDMLYILNSTKALKEQLEEPGVLGMRVEVVYEGKKPTKNKKGFHDFSVFAWPA